MEIGKRGIWSHEQMFEARPDVMYEKIAADTMMDKEPWRYNGYMKRLISRVDEGLQLEHEFSSAFCNT